MKRPTTVDASRAASFVLGTLPDDARIEMEERIAASPALRAEVETLRAVVEELALAAPPVAPRAAVRERLLAQVAAEASSSSARPARPAGPASDVPASRARPAPPPLPDLLFAFDHEAQWIRVAPGLESRVLSHSADGLSYVLRVAPGASVPTHAHRRVEHSYILSGSIDVEGTLCRAGDYHRASAGTRHTDFFSKEGCVMLILEASA